MKASELRIGNWVYEPYPEDEGGLTPTQIDSDSIQTHDQNDWAKPIPLTEEWFMKLDFDYDEDTDTWSLLTSLGRLDFMFEIYISDTYFYKHICLRNVHQLQNLYFALTGKELTVKEDAYTTI